MSYKITGSGCCVPSHVQDNSDFLDHSFLDNTGTTFDIDNKTIIEKFNAITGIEKRKYIAPHLNTSDIAFQAAKNAIDDSKIDPATLDYIIVAHNFGDIEETLDAFSSIRDRLVSGVYKKMSDKLM